MADGHAPAIPAPPHSREEAEALAWSLPLDRLSPATPLLFGLGAELAHFERLRRDDPVHYQAEHKHGPYWSITRYEDIMAVDTNHEAFRRSRRSQSPTRRRTCHCRCSSPWTRRSTMCNARR